MRLKERPGGEIPKDMVSKDVHHSHAKGFDSGRKKGGHVFEGLLLIERERGREEGGIGV